MAYHRKGLTRRSTNDKIYVIFIPSGIEVPNIRKPIFLSYFVVCEITQLAFGLNIASKHNPMLQSKSLESMLYCTDTAEHCSYPNSVLGLREL